MNHIEKFSVVLDNINTTYPIDGMPISIKLASYIRIFDIYLFDNEEIILEFFHDRTKMPFPYSYRIKSNMELNLDDIQKERGSFIGMRFILPNVEKRQIKFSYELTYI